MPSKFKYERPSREDVERRVNQSSGSFIGYLKNQFKIFKTVEGDNHIRILPPTFQVDGKPSRDAGLEIYEHGWIGPSNASVLCLRMMKGSACPVCEERARLERSGRAEKDELTQLKPKKRVLVWLLDRNDKDDVPALWSMPYSNDRDIAAISIDKATRDLYDPFDPDEGYDIYFTREGSKDRTKYVGWQLSRRASSVEDKHLDYIIRNPLTDVIIWRDYNEVKAIFEGEEVKPEPERGRDKEEPSPRREEPEEPIHPRRSREPEPEEPQSRRDREEEKPRERSRREEPEDTGRRRREPEPEEAPRSRHGREEEEPTRRREPESDERPSRRDADDRESRAERLKRSFAEQQ